MPNTYHLAYHLVGSPIHKCLSHEKDWYLNHASYEVEERPKFTTSDISWGTGRWVDTDPIEQIKALEDNCIEPVQFIEENADFIWYGECQEQGFNRQTLPIEGMDLPMSNNIILRMLNCLSAPENAPKIALRPGSVLPIYRRPEQSRFSSCQNLSQAQPTVHVEGKTSMIELPSICGGHEIYVSQHLQLEDRHGKRWEVSEPFIAPSVEDFDDVDMEDCFYFLANQAFVDLWERDPESALKMFNQAAFDAYVSDFYSEPCFDLDYFDSQYIGPHLEYFQGREPFLKSVLTSARGNVLSVVRKLIESAYPNIGRDLQHNWSGLHVRKFQFDKNGIQFVATIQADTHSWRVSLTGGAWDCVKTDR